MRPFIGRLLSNTLLWRCGLFSNFLQFVILEIFLILALPGVYFGRAEVEDVEEFVYLGATVTKEGGGTEDIKNV